MNELFHTLCNVVQQGQNATLATVVSSKGSLPMSKRAKMLIFQDGSIMGTIGGGIVEANVIEEGQQILESNLSKVVYFDLTSDQIEADGLTCGGTVEIFLESFSSDSDLTVIQEIERIYSESKTAVTVTPLPAAGSPDIGEQIFSEGKTRKILIHDDARVIGSSGHERVDQRIVELASARLGQPYLGTIVLELSPEEAKAMGIFPHTSFRLFLESILPAPTAYIFGGGHVSLHLSKILHFIGFEYMVVDDRQEFLTAERFPEAKTCVCHSFENVFDILELTPHSSYVIIVTRGHKSDMQVLVQALRSNVKYIGMIGSTRKVKLLFEELQQRGFERKLLEEVHAPIGLEIGADTPEEIAISIAAELIEVRRGEE